MMNSDIGLKTSDYFFDLPPEQIAQDPLQDRTSSKLMLLDKKTGAIQEKIFYDIIDYLNPGDCLVLNNTKVIPARLYGVRKDTGASVEILLLKQLETDEKVAKANGDITGSKSEIASDSDKSTETVASGMESKTNVELSKNRIQGNQLWECLVKPGKKCRTGAVIDFGDGKLTGLIEEVQLDGNRKIRFSFEGIWEEVLDSLGEMPLPPYITHKLQDKNRYQTVYAKFDGSAAAPTAGLHFTPELLERIKNKGISLAFVTLHVGLGTFRPVKVDNVLDHQMHSEYYQVTKEAADLINQTKANGGRVICVGTTSCRTIESAADAATGLVNPGSGDTQIFIYPGYQFKVLDCLITNFHLPESTLLMLVSALAGREEVLAAYAKAVQNKYRFFSFGDAMFITDIADRYDFSKSLV